MGNYIPTDDDKISFNLINGNVVSRLSREGRIELPHRQLDIPKDERWNEKQMSAKVLQGILNGDSIPTIARSMEEVVGRNEVSAMRNARTMVTSAQNQGRLDSFNNLAAQGVVMKKEWEATPDDRTRKSHIDIDGEEQDLDKPFSNKCMFPGDGNGPGEEVWNCRCAMGSHIIGFRRRDGSISRVNYTPDRTSHEDQMEKYKERLRSEKEKLVEMPATLANYNNAYEEFKARRADMIDDMVPFDEMNQMLNDLVENNEFRHRFPDDSADVLESIIDDGRLKTQFETEESMGMYSPFVRANASHNLFGTDINSIDDSQFEKYGYLGSSDILKDRSIGLATYGDGMITFNKDALFDRTTLTVGDSLRDSSDGRYIMGTMVNNIDSTVCIGRPRAINEYIQRMSDSIEKDGIDNASKVGYSVRSYIELQYHGNITLADIDSITARKEIWDEIAQDSDRVNALLENNISCYYIDYKNNELVEYVFK